MMPKRLRYFLDARDWAAIRVWLAVPLLAVGGWMVTWRHPASYAQRACAERYAAAATPADTLRIDRQAVGVGSKGGAWNCGMLRHADEARS